MVQVKDLPLTINIREERIANQITTKINGELKSFIISSDKQISIKISLVEHPELPPIYRNRGIIGTKHIPLKVRAVDWNDQGFNYDNAYYMLNNKLLIQVQGPAFTNVEIIVRYI